MSLFGSGFGNDPFFGGHRSIMSQMDQMMSTIMRDPFQDDPFFGGGGGGGLAALTAGPAAATAAAALVPRHPHHQRPRQAAAHPFNALGIPSIANMMSSIDQMSQQGNCQMYSSSSVMTMSTGPDGRPQVYQATASSREVPGGVRETRRTMNDSRTGTRKMAIGHHIGERSHIIEREHQNQGESEERQEFINLEENEADVFNHEFQRRTQQAIGGRGGSALQYRQPRRQPREPSYSRSTASVPAITASRYRSRSRPQLSITAGPSEDRARWRDREHRSNRSHPHRYDPAL